MITRKAIKSMIYALISVAGLTQASIASTLVIKNDGTAVVEVVIQPGEGSTFSSSPEIRRSLDPGKEEKINISSTDLGGSSVFVVKGKVTLPSTRNVCYGLFTDKNYRISFVDTTTGVACYQEPLTHPTSGKEGNK